MKTHHRALGVGLMLLAFDASLARTADQASPVPGSKEAPTMLSAAKLMAFVATSDASRARAFYEKTLGLHLLSDETFALVFDSNGTQLRIQKVQKTQPVPFTVLGWEVPNIEEAITALRDRGVVFERFGFMRQDDLAVWIADDQTKVAWFKDPDGNLLSLTQFR